jgi:hypothetical protein
MLQPNELLNLAPKSTVDINEIEIWVHRIDQASVFFLLLTENCGA